MSSPPFDPQSRPYGQNTPPYGQPYGQPDPRDPAYGRPPGAPPAQQSQQGPYTHRYEERRGAGQAETTQALPFGGVAGGPPSTTTQPKRRGGLILVAALLAGLVGGVGGAAGYGALDDDEPTTRTVSSLDTDRSTSTRTVSSDNVEGVAAKVLPSTVQLNVTGESNGSQAAGSGTGIIISNDGEILTNNHVVEAAADSGTITVSFNDGSTADGTIVGRDDVTDLAVVKVDVAAELTPATLGSSSDLKVGQSVVAVGSPFGLESTVTSGIVSALNRPVSSSDGSNSGTSTVFPAIQTDAAINPGNSGGPLVDLDGNVVGINSAIRGTSSSATEQSGSIGLGFAIPVDLAKNVAQQLSKGKTVEHARIGITVGNKTESDGITSVGAVVKEVTDGGAGDEAGLETGDVITALNDNPINSSDGLVAAIRAYQPGETVTLAVIRSGETDQVEVTLDSDGGSLGS
ncbi:MAG: trypsin-like peptidase domain-containing protein [Nocardioidaceae bacterium]